MSHPWSGADDDRLLELLGQALAPPERAPAPRAPVVPLSTAVRPPGGRRPWLAAAAAVLLLGAGAAALTAGDDDDAVVAASSTTGPMMLVVDRAEQLEDALAGTDLDDVADAAQDLRAALDSARPIDDEILEHRVVRLLDEADERLVTGTTSTTATTAPSPPATTGTTVPTALPDVSGPCDEAEHADDPACTGDDGGSDDGSHDREEPASTEGSDDATSG